MIDYRPATEADVPACCELLRQLFSIEVDFDFDAERASGALRALIAAQPRTLVLVAVRKQRVCGMLSVQRLISTAEGGEVGLIEDVIVDQDQRAQGIGRELIQEAERWASEQGFSRLQLLADRDNLYALGFYRAQAWRETNLMAWRRPLMA